jgi:transposase
VVDEAAIRQRYQVLADVADERVRRLMVAAEALAIGRGGQLAVARATGVSRTMIQRGIREVLQPELQAPKGRVRRPGGGRKAMAVIDPTLRDDLERLVEPTSRGDPESPLRWTCKSVRKLAAELTAQGHQTSHRMVAELLHDLGYSLQANQKTLEGSDHPDRNAQFEYLNGAVQQQLWAGEPTISVDTKKELIGPFKNGGRELRPKGEPEQVLTHDFIIRGLGRVSPYGVYDLGQNEAWVSVGIDHDTASFAVESIRRWWWSMGYAVYSKATRLLITADAGGSNGYRLRLWKLELQKLADETGLEIAVCHFPPGTSKWNKIEHRLFSAITQNWRGKPLVSHEVVVNLIGATTTQTGLKVKSELDTNQYPAGRIVSDDELSTIHIRRDVFHGDWNYALLPRPGLL